MIKSSAVCLSCLMYLERRNTIGRPLGPQEPGKKGEGPDNIYAI
jgi:hypothetical protein